MQLFFPDHKISFIKIPKNACSTVIYSLGRSVIGDSNPHHVDHMFLDVPPQSEDWPSIAVARDPYSRLVSGYLNKLVAPEPEEDFAHELLDAVWNNQRGQPRPGPQYSITFTEFVRYVEARPDSELDQHWQSQSYLIGTVKPTVLFSVDMLRRQWELHPLTRNIELVDFAPHATKSDLDLTTDLSVTDGYDIAAFRRIAGKFPPQHCFRAPELEAIVRKRYASDYDLLARTGGALAA